MLERTTAVLREEIDRVARAANAMAGVSRSHTPTREPLWPPGILSRRAWAGEQTTCTLDQEVESREERRAANAGKRRKQQVWTRTSERWAVGRLNQAAPLRTVWALKHGPSSDLRSSAALSTWSLDAAAYRANKWRTQKTAFAPQKKTGLRATLTRQCFPTRQREMDTVEPGASPPSLSRQLHLSSVARLASRHAKASFRTPRRLGCFRHGFARERRPSAQLARAERCF